MLTDGTLEKLLELMHARRVTRLLVYLAGLKDGTFVVTGREGGHDKDAQEFQKEGDVLEFEK